MGFCLPKELTQPFLRAVRDGDLDPVKMSEMTSDERRVALAKVVGEENAKEANALYESKLLLKDQQAGLIRWIKSVGGLSEAAERSLVAKVSKMENILSPADEDAFLKDIAAKKLGTEVTPEEAKTITSLAQKAQLERAKPTTNLSGFSDAYLKAANDLRDYVQSLKPVSAPASIGKNLATIARNNLLFNPATPLKTIVGQLMNSTLDFVTRRVGTLTARGLSGDLVSRANAEAWRTFRTTGDNTAAMESMDDIGKLGEKKSFDVSSGMDSTNPVVRNVERGIRAVANVSNKIVIDWAHVQSFTKVYQKAFFDLNNLLATRIAKEEGLTGTAAKTRADAIFSDAARIKPTTKIGAIVREEGQRNAARVTSTNDGLIGDLAVAVKDGMNKALPGLGDILMPIAKIPATIIWNGIENAGAALPKGVLDIFRGRAKIASSDLATKYEGMAQYAHGIQAVSRVIGTVAAAAYFSSLLTSQDFKTDSYGNHYVKIAGTWINTEYIAAISPALSGFMNIRANTKPGQNATDVAEQYTSGALEGWEAAPGVTEYQDFVTAITNPDVAKGIQKYASTFFSERAVPAFIPNLLQGKYPNIIFGASGVPSPAELKKLTQKYITIPVK